MKKTGILIIFLLFCQVGFTQSISYSYDFAGNRTERFLTVEKIKQNDSISKNDSIEGIAGEDLQVNNPKKLTETVNDKVITVYPNPTEGLLKISITNFDKGTGSIKLYTINGSELLKISPLQAENLINISDKTNGTYMMEIMLDGNKSVWKIVKR